jgi:hypothetical protein
MKTTKTTPIVQIDAEELAKYSPVNENLSAENHMPQPSIKGKVFSTADLWRLRRNSRTQGIVIR